MMIFCYKHNDNDVCDYNSDGNDDDINMTLIISKRMVTMETVRG